MPEPFAITRLVEFSDTDMAGIAHFSAFFRWMEAAEQSLRRSVGLSVFTKLGEHQVSFPRVHAECDYTSPARCEDELRIEVAVERLGEKSVTFAFQFSVEGRQIASGRMTGVCCKIVHGEPPDSIAIPEAIADRLREHIAPPA